MKDGLREARKSRFDTTKLLNVNAFYCNYDLCTLTCIMLCTCRYASSLSQLLTLVVSVVNFGDFLQKELTIPIVLVIQSAAFSLRMSLLYRLGLVKIRVIECFYVLMLTS